jgi:hydroxymethylbilane synthase
VSRLDDPATRASALCERAFLRRLEGGCQVPIAGHATVSGDRIRLEGLVAELDGRRVFRGVREGALGDAVALGTELAEVLLGQGADRVLAALKAQAL